MGQDTLNAKAGTEGVDGIGRQGALDAEAGTRDVDGISGRIWGGG